MVLTLTSGDRFGYSIDNLGDLNADGVNDLAVGAPYEIIQTQIVVSTHHVHGVNVDASVTSTVEINDSTTNGPS